MPLTKTTVGLTTIELITTLAIVAILLTLMLPNWGSFIAKNKVDTQVNQIIRVIHFARSEAIQRSKNITLCGSSRLSECDGQWSKGMLVFYKDKNQFHLIRDFIPVTSDIEITWRGLSGEELLRVTPFGVFIVENGRFTISRNGYSRTLVLSRTGRIREG